MKFIKRYLAKRRRDAIAAQLFGAILIKNSTRAPASCAVESVKMTEVLIAELDKARPVQ